MIAVLPGYFESFLTALNPFQSESQLDFDWLVKNQFNPFMLIYDSPIATAPDGSAVPRQATSWEMLLQGAESDLDAGQARARYYCDSNANWTDSQQLDAEDYRFTFEYYANNSLVEGSELLDIIKITGDYIAGVTLDAPIIFAYRIIGALPILPAHVWEGRNASTWTPDVADVIGSGPFAVSTFVENESLSLIRNVGYYPEIDSEAPTLRSLQMVPDDPIPAESVVFRIFVDDRSRISSVILSYTYIVGQINFTGSQGMVEGPSGYEATIPSRITASTVEYEITATDIWGNSAIIAAGSYSREDTTTDGTMDPILAATISIGISAVFIVLIIVLVKRRQS
jgi:ABC-type transport system substrate-binding protein